MKKEYIKPMMEVVKILTTTILAGSLYESVTTTGFDEGDELIGVGDGGLPTTGSIWNDAW